MNRQGSIIPSVAGFPKTAGQVERVVSQYKEANDEYLTVEEVADICGKCAFSMVTAGLAGVYRSDLNRMIEAEGWGTLPKGWTQESAKKFWTSLTGDVKHKITKCIKEMEGLTMQVRSVLVCLDDSRSDSMSKRHCGVPCL